MIIDDCPITLSPALESALRQEYMPAFGAADTSLDLIAPARCHAHDGESPLTCDALTHESGRQAVHLLRCHAHAAEGPLECLARGPFPVDQHTLWHIREL